MNAQRCPACGGAGDLAKSLGPFRLVATDQQPDLMEVQFAGGGMLALSTEAV
jgi:hypothetical protein